jgi:hypothetical protein
MSGVSERNNFPTFHSIPCSYHLQIYPSHHRRYSSPLDFISFHVRKRSTSKHLCPASITSFQALLLTLFVSAVSHLNSSLVLVWESGIPTLHYAKIHCTTLQYTTLPYRNSILPQFYPTAFPPSSPSFSSSLRHSQPNHTHTHPHPLISQQHIPLSPPQQPSHPHHRTTFHFFRAILHHPSNSLTALQDCTSPSA